MSRITRFFSLLALALALSIGATGCVVETHDGYDDDTGHLELTFLCSAPGNTWIACNDWTDEIALRLYPSGSNTPYPTEYLHWSEGSTIYFSMVYEGYYGFDAYGYMNSFLVYGNDGIDQWEAPYELYVSPYKTNRYTIYLTAD
ncbi:MAG: hypothetical protein LBM75_03255 [Myxococcales bacterium]|jgi:hypothetical protein|nr:hypothetical protein [Myxococcales bacterium]